jgi:hypothetical protein
MIVSHEAPSGQAELRLQNLRLGAIRFSCKVSSNGGKERR